MAYSAIAAGDVDADSPLTDALGAQFKDNFDAHEGRLNATDANTIPWDGLQLPIKFPYVEVTGALTLGSTHGVVIGDTSGGAFTITLPLASANPRVIYAIGQKGASNVTVSRSGAELLVDVVAPSGATTIVLTDGQIIALISDGGSRWRKLWDSRV